jgi:glycosyltransferase involved in cell wall biosynthesis
MPFTIGIDARQLRDFGIGTYVRNLVEALAARDRENRYVLFVGRHRFDTLPDNFQQVVERAPIYSLREQVALSWRIRRMRLDLYHATHYVLPAYLSCPAVVTIHDIIHLLYPEFLPNALALFYAQRMIGRSLRLSRRVISVSLNTKLDLIDTFGVSSRKIRVVYNGVEDVFRRRLAPDALHAGLARLGIGARPYALFVGNPKPHKNLENVLRSFALAVPRVPAIEPELVCVGARGDGSKRLELLARQLGIADRVRFLGHLPQQDLPAVYQGATVFLYPTLYEGFGLPVIEAMASGVPVVTSDSSSLVEIAQDAAEIVSPFDVEQIAAAIARLLGDPAQRAELARRGLRRADDFGWPRAAEKTLEVYAQALRGPAPASDLDDQTLSREIPAARKHRARRRMARRAESTGP